MSFANALDGNKKIAAMYLPSGLLTNPMTVNLDMNGYDIVQGGDINGTNVKGLNLILNDGNENTRILSVGAEPTYNLVVDGGATIQGDTIIDGNVNAESVTTGPLTITTTSGGGIDIESGDLAFTGVSQNITGVNNITASGTVGASAVTATGTVSSALWSSFPQFGIGSTLTWSNPATSFDILNTAADAGLYLITVSFTITKSGISVPTAPITIQYINSSAQNIILAESTEDSLENVGYTVSYLYYQPVSGNITVQLDGGSLGAGESYTITSNGMGFIRLT